MCSRDIVDATRTAIFVHFLNNPDFAPEAPEGTAAGAKARKPAWLLAFGMRPGPGGGDARLWYMNCITGNQLIFPEAGGAAMDLKDIIATLMLSEFYFSVPLKERKAIVYRLRDYYGRPLDHMELAPAGYSTYSLFNLSARVPF